MVISTYILKGNVQIIDFKSIFYILTYIIRLMAKSTNLWTASTYGLLSLQTANIENESKLYKEEIRTSQ